MPVASLTDDDAADGNSGKPLGESAGTGNFMIDDGMGTVYTVWKGNLT